MEKRKELEQLLMMDEQSTLEYTVEQLKLLYGEVVTDGNNYVVTQGTSSIALVAHVDTVSWGTKGMTLAWNKNVLRNELGILGADDRAGVFGILEAVKKAKTLGLPLPSVIFTNHEESGGRGVKKFIKDQVFSGTGTNLFVELDRKGCNEYVFYTSSLPKQVKDYIESFGYCQKEGSYSDIMDLAFAYKIPAVNLSVGYYSQHTQFETLHWDELWLTINRVVEMLADPIPVLYTLSDRDCRSWGGGGYSRYSELNYHGGEYGYASGYGDYYDTYKGKVVTLPTYNSQNYTGTNVTPPVDTIPAAQHREWEEYLGSDDDDFHFEEEESIHDLTEYDFMDILKVEVYCAIVDENLDEIYAKYFEDVSVIAFIDNFFDFFSHEVFKHGFSENEKIPEKELDVIFDATWNLVSNVYGSKL